MDTKKSPSPKITVRSASAWFFGIVFLLGGIGTLATNVVGGLVFIALSAILLPPLYKKLPIDLSSGIKFVLVLVGFGIVTATTDTDSLSTSTPALPRTVTNQAEPAPKAATALLELQSMNGTRQYNFITVTGEVKNISDKPMEAVQAVVSFYTEDGTFVKESSAIIEYNPILAGQTSPFKAIGTDNPAIKTWKVTFKKLFGGTIPTTQLEK